jgi:hypothetical protein
VSQKAAELNIPEENYCGEAVESRKHPRIAEERRVALRVSISLSESVPSVDDDLRGAKS